MMQGAQQPHYSENNRENLTDVLLCVFLSFSLCPLRISWAPAPKPWRARRSCWSWPIRRCAPRRRTASPRWPTPPAAAAAAAVTLLTSYSLFFWTFSCWIPASKKQTNLFRHVQQVDLSHSATFHVKQKPFRISSLLVSSPLSVLLIPRRPKTLRIGTVLLLPFFFFFFFFVSGHTLLRAVSHLIM